MNATVVTLIGLVLALLLMYLSANFKFFAIVISFGLGFFAFALVPAVQTLIIEVFKGSEMLGSTLSIAGFNIANAIGAFAWWFTNCLWLLILKQCGCRYDSFYIRSINDIYAEI